MDAKEHIQLQVTICRDSSDWVMAGSPGPAITEEQFNWVPLGTASPISVHFVHSLATEDNMIHTLLQGKPDLWLAGEWGEKIGLKSLPAGRQLNWDELRGKPLPLAPILAYQQVIRSATDAFLAGLTADDLDREVDFRDVRGRKGTVRLVMMYFVVHGLKHNGEMATLKRMQGVEGLPF